MGFEVNVDDSDIESLQAELKALNIRSTADESMQEVLEDEFVPFLVNKIRAKGLVGEGPDKGDGPPLASEEAWEVIRHGNMDYTVRTTPLVSERAFYLEFGTANLIFAEDVTESGSFRFESTEGPTAGQIIYPKVIRGVEEYAFFREAVQEFNASDRLVNKVGDDLVDHIQNNLNF